MGGGKALRLFRRFSRSALKENSRGKTPFFPASGFCRFPSPFLGRKSASDEPIFGPEFRLRRAARRTSDGPIGSADFRPRNLGGADFSKLGSDFWISRKIWPQICENPPYKMRKKCESFTTPLDCHFFCILMGGYLPLVPFCFL